MVSIVILKNNFILTKKYPHYIQQCGLKKFGLLSVIAAFNNTYYILSANLRLKTILSKTN